MAAIFDMDGLLLNTDPVIWVESMHEVAKAHNINVTTELLKHTKGLRIYEVTGFWNDFFGWNDLSKANTLAEEILDTVITNTHKKGKVMPGAIPLLQSLTEAHIPIGLATSSPKRMVNDLLAFFDLVPFFKVLSTADDCIAGKPHPEVYLNCAAALGVLPWRCVAFEDSVNGMVAAKAARMQVVAVPSEEQFDSVKFGLADKKVRNLTEFSTKDYFDLLEI